MEATRVEKSKNKAKCNKCGYVLDAEEGVVVKDANGEEKSRYHKACFQALFK
jgi:rubredoxin